MSIVCVRHRAGEHLQIDARRDRAGARLDGAGSAHVHAVPRIAGKFDRADLAEVLAELVDGVRRRRPRPAAFRPGLAAAPVKERRVVLELDRQAEKMQRRIRRRVGAAQISGEQPKGARRDRAHRRRSGLGAIASAAAAP